MVGLKGPGGWAEQNVDCSLGRKASNSSEKSLSQSPLAHASVISSHQDCHKPSQEYDLLLPNVSTFNYSSLPTPPHSGNNSEVSSPEYGCFQQDEPQSHDLIADTSILPDDLKGCYQQDGPMCAAELDELCSYLGDDSSVAETSLDSDSLLRAHLNIKYWKNGVSSRCIRKSDGSGQMCFCQIAPKSFQQGGSKPSDVSQSLEEDWNKAGNQQDKLVDDNVKKTLKSLPTHADCDGTSAFAKNKSGRKRKSSSENLLKRPKNGFIRYSIERRAQVARQYPKLDNREVSCMLGLKWKSLPAQEKERYEKAFREEMEKRRRQYPLWNYATTNNHLPDNWDPLLSRLRPRHKLYNKYISNLNRSCEQDKTRRKQTWVQCDHCLQWWELTPNVDVHSLPEKWYCKLNNPPRECILTEELPSLDSSFLTWPVKVPKKEPIVGQNNELVN